MLRFPHGLIRRHLATIERMLVAAGLAGVVLGLMHGLPAYPPNWDVVLAVLVFGLTWWSPMVGYLLAVLAAAYPIYNLSLYLAVIFLAVALLGVRVFANNLGGTLLVLLSPWLGPWYLFWVTPVLGGLWWGAAGGAAMGGLSALWGQLVAGMAGLSPDWLARLGIAPNATALVARFAEADSLQTLLLMLEPLVPDSTTMLYFLLQVILWSVVGALVGSLAERPWAQQRRPWASIGIGWFGLAALVVGHVLLVLWLGLYEWSVLAGLWSALFGSLVLTGLLIGLLESLQDLVELPLPSRNSRHRPALQQKKIVQKRVAPAEISSQSPANAESQETEDDQDADDLIMLELD